MRNIHDHDCCHWQVVLNGWPVLWGLSVLEVDTEQDYVLVAFREGDTGPLIPHLEIAGSTPFAWPDGTIIAATKVEGAIELQPAVDCEQHAYWQGQFDRLHGMAHWGRARYYAQYNLQAAYDKGWQDSYT